MNMNLLEGARSMRILVGIGGAAIIGFHTLPHVIPTRTIEPHHTIPSCVPGQKYEKLLKEVCTQMNIDSNKINLFYNNGFKTVSGGCLKFPGKSVIGLPRHCSFNTIEDIRNAPISFQNQSINWESNVGKALEESFMISDEQIKFLMARELVHIKNSHFVAITFHAIGLLLATYMGGLLAVSLVKGSYQRVMVLRLIPWCIGVTVYTSTRQRLSHWLEGKADESAAQLGLDYSIGGVDCMNSRLKLNRILRKLNGSDGEKIFSDEGDNLDFKSSLPRRTDRLERIKEIKESFQKQIDQTLLADNF